MIPWIPAGTIDTSILTQSDVLTVANHRTVHIKWQGHTSEVGIQLPEHQRSLFKYIHVFIYVCRKQLHTTGIAQPPVEAIEGKQQLTRLMRNQCFIERCYSSFRFDAKGGERLRSLNNSSNNNINRGTDVVRNCNIIVTVRTLHFISVTQGSKPARLVTAPTRTPTSVWTMPFVLVTNASVTTGSSKLTGHVPHVSV